MAGVGGELVVVSEGGRLHPVQRCPLMLPKHILHHCHTQPQPDSKVPAQAGPVIQALHPHMETAG